jgi:teichuronic acid biosynthesis glycosyltransferase TuaC
VLRVVTLSTLFPNSAHPNLGIFVETQTLRLAASKDVELRVVNPIGVPWFPLRLHSQYRDLYGLPREETWKGLHVARPQFSNVPILSGRFNPALLYHVAAPVLRRWRAEGFNFDVIDAEFFYPDGPAAARLAKEFGVPFLIKARGADIHYWGTRPDCRGSILAAAKQADYLLAVSRSLCQDMTAMGMAADKISVHYTGVDLERFHPVSERERAAALRALNVKGPLVVSVGALIPRKAHDIAIEAIVEIENATLLIVGAGQERSRLASLVQARGLGKRVRLIGSVSHSELPAMLAAADVMVLMSKSEGLANAWVEALACGTPLVISDVDGAREVLDCPEAGCLLKERTPAAVTEAIKAILASPPPRDAVRRSAERFTWQKNTSELYRRLMSLRELQISSSI